MIHLNKQRLPPHSCFKAQELWPFQNSEENDTISYIIEQPPDWNISPTFSISDIHDYHPPESEVSIPMNSELNSFQIQASDAGASSVKT